MCRLTGSHLTKQKKSSIATLSTRLPALLVLQISLWRLRRRWLQRSWNHSHLALSSKAAGERSSRCHSISTPTESSVHGSDGDSTWSRVIREWWALSPFQVISSGCLICATSNFGNVPSAEDSVYLCEVTWQIHVESEIIVMPPSYGKSFKASGLLLVRFRSYSQEVTDAPGWCILDLVQYREWAGC